MTYNPFKPVFTLDNNEIMVNRFYQMTPVKDSQYYTITFSGPFDLKVTAKNVEVVIHETYGTVFDLHSTEELECFGVDAPYFKPVLFKNSIPAVLPATAIITPQGGDRRNSAGWVNVNYEGKDDKIKDRVNHRATGRKWEGSWSDKAPKEIKADRVPMPSTIARSPDPKLAKELEDKIKAENEAVYEHFIPEASLEYPSEDKYATAQKWSDEAEEERIIQSATEVVFNHFKNGGKAVTADESAPKKIVAAHFETASTDNYDPHSDMNMLLEVETIDGNIVLTNEVIELLSAETVQKIINTRTKVI